MKPFAVFGIIVATAFVTTAVNLAVLPLTVEKISWRTPGRAIPLRDQNGKKQLSAEVTEGPGGIVFLTLVRGDVPATWSVQSERDGSMRLDRRADRGGLVERATPGESPSVASASRTDTLRVLLPDPVAAPPAARTRTEGAESQVPVAASDGGTIHGVVRYTGEVHPRAPLRMGSDPYCQKRGGLDESLIVNANGTLRNVLITVTDLPPSEPPATPVLVEQSGCTYQPHVVALVAGQTLRVLNLDQTLHNVHTYRASPLRTLHNAAQIPGSAAIEMRVKDEGWLKVKCDVHPWMTGHIWVQRNAYFAITGEDGSFAIVGVPPGRHRLAAWHERFSAPRESDVEVSALGPSTLDLEAKDSGFMAAPSANP